MSRKRFAKSALKKIKLLLLDVDGVMTDGGIYFSEKGDEFKKFNIKDGYGIVQFQKQGFQVGIVTGRVSELVQRRAEELGIRHVYQNLSDKLSVYHSLKAKLRLGDEEIAAMGDDVPDIPILEVCGFSAAPSDAVEAVKKRVDYVCRRRGGDGAVREVIDLVMSAHERK
ncbi:MAG TPA: HAD hydrolase family protein [Bacteroidota bacterium]|nr:HAD hydrolase family protein [Bacteroidota bacterium]